MANQRSIDCHTHIVNQKIKDAYYQNPGGYAIIMEFLPQFANAQMPDESWQIAAADERLFLSPSIDIHKEILPQLSAIEEKMLAQPECTDAKGYRDRAMLELLYATGIRVSELQYITVEAAKRGEAVVSLKGKTRTVFLVKELRKKLLRYAAEQNIQSGAVFITRTGKPMNRTNIWREMKGLCEQAEVNPQKVFPHNLRHLFARVFYGIEKDLAKLADILGHSSINTTRIYIISTGDEHRRRMEHMRLLL